MAAMIGNIDMSVGKMKQFYGFGFHGHRGIIRMFIRLVKGEAG